MLLPFLTAHEDEDNIRALLHELVLFIGYCVVENEENQTIFRWGQVPNLLQYLCNLPFDFFVDDESKEILFPTLTCLAYNNEPNKKVMMQEINTTLVADYTRQQMNKAATEEGRCASAVYRFERRFPRRLWEDAIAFF